MKYSLIISILLASVGAVQAQSMDEPLVVKEASAYPWQTRYPYITDITRSDLMVVHGADLEIMKSEVVLPATAPIPTPRPCFDACTVTVVDGAL